jgi:hypothetical protein
MGNAGSTRAYIEHWDIYCIYATQSSDTGVEEIASTPRDCVERFNHADAVVVCAFGVGRAFFPPAKRLFGLRGPKTAHTRLSAYAPATQAYRCTQGPPPLHHFFVPSSL